MLLFCEHADLNSSLCVWKEVEAIENEVRRMESDVAEIKTMLSSPEAFPSPREDKLKV